MSWYRGAFLIVLTGWVWMLVATLTERVAFVRPPSYLSDDTETIWQIRVQRHPANRLLVVAAFDGDLPVRETRQLLHGETSPALFNVKWRLPEGRLAVVAAVYDTEGASVRAVHEVTVIGHGP